jgi:hypothetical protein
LDDSFRYAAASGDGRLGSEQEGHMEAHRDTEMAGVAGSSYGIHLDTPPSVGNSTKLAAIQPASEQRFLTPIEALPMEILTTVLGYLDVPQPSTLALQEEPHFKLTESENTTLKAVSCVSRRLREAAIPILFKHAQFIVPAATVRRSKVRRSTLSKQIRLFLDFVVIHSLQKSIASLTLLVHDPQIYDSVNVDGKPKLNGFASFWKTLFTVIDPLELLIVAPAEALGALTSCHVYLPDAWRFDCPCHYLRLQRPAGSPRFSSSIDEDIPAEQYTEAGLVDQELETESSSDDNISEPFTEDEFPVVHDSPESFERPERPRTDLEVTITAISSAEDPWEVERAESSALFEIRPWSKLLLNEGSFIRAYATYEYWLRQPPSVSAVLPVYSCQF